jgi:general secretion pathway protein L
VILCVHLPRLASFAADSVLRFETIDGQRRIAQRGEAVLAALPRADGCELVLHPFDALLVPVRLPKLGGAKLGAALPGLVEDRLAGETEHAHVVATPRGADGEAMAAVVDRALFARALAFLSRAGLRVVAATAAPLALPHVPGRWRLHVDGDVAVVRTGACAGAAFPASETPPRELALLVAQAGAPTSIDASGACDAQAWSLALSVPVRAVPPPDAVPAPALDLLQYGFAAGIADPAAWRPTAILAAMLAVVFVGGLQLDAWRMRGEARDLRARMAGIVTGTFPEVPVVLDPVLQMQRLVADLDPGADRGGFVDLAAALAQIAGDDPVDAIDYREGTLSVTFRWPSAERDAKRAALVTRAASAGLAATAGGDAVQLRRAPAP